MVRPWLPVMSFSEPVGYNDVSGGSAFYWSCAFHCEGGPYYATEGCICACLTPEQETAWRGHGWLKKNGGQLALVGGLEHVFPIFWE